MNDNAKLWQASDLRMASTQMRAWERWLARERQLAFDNYDQLHAWSVTHKADFWKCLADYFSLRFHENAAQVLVNDHMPGAQWFPGATLNFAEHLLRYRDERPALISWLENGERRELSYADLYAQVARLAGWMRQQGVCKGDRVAGFLANTQEAVIAMLAATSIGAVWSSCSPDFGLQGVLDRFGQITPKILFATNGYYYNGKHVDCMARIHALARALPTLSALVVVHLTPAATDGELPDKGCWWNDATSDESGLAFVPVEFSHPLYILYSSGTTGVPKCIVHGTGGTLLQHLKELSLHTDISRQDVVFYYTTCGWMMWNWLISSLALGATVVLYDGSPFAQKPDILWDIAEKENVSVFGTSAKYLAALEKTGTKPKQNHALSPLKTVLSTGSPLAHESFDFVYRDIKTDVCLSSISGGTDIISCFVVGNPTLPVYRGELQCKGLGMDVDIVNDTGESVLNEKGELICRSAFPSMPIGFWNDADGQKFRQAYFERFPGVWAHGDYGAQRENGGLIIYGRSDAVLNPGGVRIGTAEIYRQVDRIPEVLESIAIGQDWRGDVRIVLFVRLREGVQLDENLQAQIRRTIRQHTTARHVPEKILQVTDIPRTISGKVVELAVRNVVHGLPVRNTEALANAEALEQYRQRPELAE